MYVKNMAMSMCLYGYVAVWLWLCVCMAMSMCLYGYVAVWLWLCGCMSIAMSMAMCLYVCVVCVGKRALHDRCRRRNVEVERMRTQKKRTQNKSAELS